MLRKKRPATITKSHAPTAPLALVLCSGPVKHYKYIYIRRSLPSYVPRCKHTIMDGMRAVNVNTPA